MEKTSITTLNHPSDRSGIPVCAAILTNTSVEEFELFAGTLEREEYKYLTMYDLVAYLNTKKLHLGAHLDGRMGASAFFGNDALALLTIESKNEKDRHLAVWTGSVVFDPNHNEPRALNSVKIFEWWPIIQWKE